MILSATLIAEAHMAEVSQQYREETIEGGTGDMWFLLIPVAAIALAYAIYQIYNRIPSVVNAPTGLLTELCQAHGLGSKATGLLHRIARASELEQPAAILMSIDNFESALSQASRRIRFKKAEQKAISQVRRNVFAS